LGKALAAAQIIVGIILLLIGFGIIIGMIASNMPLIIAGTFLLIAIVLIAMAIWLFGRAHKNARS
jgi:protein-S-isoprenylcysteine O-methyltransferase Ste14